MEFLSILWALPAVRGAVGGFGVAFAIDIQSWLRHKQAEPKFDWEVAVKRWILGAITGSGLFPAVN
jgi:hypothetical protein